MIISTTPTHLPTVPSFHTSSAPKIRPKMVQPIGRWRETSSATSTLPPLRIATSFSSLAAPVSGEVGDSDLDFGERDIAELAVANDFLTIYHDVRNCARRQ